MLALPLVRDQLAPHGRRCCSSGAACVAALYTIGLAHLGSRLSGRDLASANAAFVFCYGVGMVLGPQAIGIGMDLFGPDGFGWSLALFFALYIALAVAGAWLASPTAARRA